MGPQGSDLGETSRLRLDVRQRRRCCGSMAGPARRRRAGVASLAQHRAGNADVRRNPSLEAHFRQPRTWCRLSHASARRPVASVEVRIWEILAHSQLWHRVGIVRTWFAKPRPSPGSGLWCKHALSWCSRPFHPPTHMMSCWRARDQVFTTVGFGDMFPVSVGEIMYVCMLMGIGAVVHSIVISEVINVVTTQDKANEFVSKQNDLIESFVSHTEVGENVELVLKKCVEALLRNWGGERVLAARHSASFARAFARV